MAAVAEKRMTMKGETLKKKAVQKAPSIAKEGDKKTKKKTEANLTGSKKSTIKDYPKKEKNAGKENITEDYKERAEVAEAELEELKKNVGTTIDNYRKRAEQAEAALEEWEKNISTTIEKYQKRTEKAEIAAAALDEFKKEILTILNAGDEQLKKQCRDEKVRIFGGAAMKHKYACALLKGRVEK